MVLSVVILLVSLVVILVAAGLFTNGIEWLGKKINLSEGAVGSVLAAVGTALPETMIPVIAIIGGGAEEANVGIGAILGAPFMLATLAFFVVGVAAISFRKRKTGSLVNVDSSIFQRDMTFFLLVFSLAAVTSFLPWMWLRYSIAILLVILYLAYVYKTVRDGASTGESELEPLIFSRKAEEPGMFPVIAQVVVALGLIVASAHYFVQSITEVSIALSVSPLVLSLLITPVATELPEKFNSIFWMRDGKDTLAMGNITGAMVFQSSLIPALGISFTPWELTTTALISVVLALLSCLLVLVIYRWRRKLSASVLIASGSLYLLFILYVVLGARLGWPVA